MAIFVNGNNVSGIQVDSALADTNNPVKNSTLNTYLNNNTSLSTASKQVIGAINELDTGKVGRFSTMPIPVAAYANGIIFQYVGITTSTSPIYIHGRFYECVETETSGVYTWQEVIVTSAISMQNVYDAIYPIGFTFIGFVAPPVPMDVSALWSDVSADYNNRYFKVSSTAAAGTSEAESLPTPFILNSTAHKHDVQCLWQQGEPQTSGSGYNIFGKSSAAAWGTTADGGVHTHGVGNVPYADGAPVRPLTTTIKVFRRTA